MLPPPRGLEPARLLASRGWAAALATPGWLFKAYLTRPPLGSVVPGFASRWPPAQTGAAALGKKSLSVRKLGSWGPEGPPAHSSSERRAQAQQGARGHPPPAPSSRVGVDCKRPGPSASGSRAPKTPLPATCYTGARVLPAAGVLRATRRVAQPHSASPIPSRHVPRCRRFFRFSRAFGRPF